MVLKELSTTLGSSCQGPACQSGQTAAGGGGDLDVSHLESDLVGAGRQGPRTQRASYRTTRGALPTHGIAIKHEPAGGEQNLLKV